MHKKICSVLYHSIIFLLCLFMSGCSLGHFASTSESSMPSEDSTNEIADISLFCDIGFWVPPVWDQTPGTITGDISAITGVSLDVMEITQNADTQLKILLLNDKLPDIISVTDTVTINQLVTSGKVWKLDEFFQLYKPDSHLLSYVPEDVMTELIKRDGAWYAFPSHINSPLAQERWIPTDRYQTVNRYGSNFAIIWNSSYIYWQKSSGNQPILLFFPVAQTAFLDLKAFKESPLFGPRFGADSAYEGLVYASIVSQNPGISCNGNSFILNPSETKSFHMRMLFLSDTSEISAAMSQSGLMTLKCVPGIVGPIDTEFQVMTKPTEAQLITEASDKILDSTVVNGWRVSKIRFGSYGKRMVRLTHQGNTASYCFFITEPIKNIIRQHAAFVAANHFETDPDDPCYHGLLMWDMVNQRRINASFNPYYEDWWRGGSDDPGLASGLFLSEKNVYQPEDNELHVLNAFVEDFILNRLTEQPGWRVHRMVPWYEMFEPWAGLGADDVWRAFNYVHVINIMRNMYLIQKQNQVPYLRTATDYLRMAYEYTLPMFHYWMFPNGVGASEYGNMGEMTLPLSLAQDLAQEGMLQEAAQLNAIFDKKAHFFASQKFPFGSEMAYDSTAFEAVYGYGKRIRQQNVMRAAATASYSNRGKQPVWYLYQTDVRGGGDTEWNTSYMTQLGAYPILDYTLDEGHVNEDWILSYYGAYLAGWLIYNSGGCWNSDPKNQGATGWITIGSKINQTDAKIWTESDRKQAGMPYVNGCVSLSGEAGLGYFGALRTACSIVMEHSVLGLTGLGCKVEKDENRTKIQLNDGLGMRLYYVPGHWKIEVTGGYLKQVRIEGNSILADAHVWGHNGMKVLLKSIPEEDEEQKVISKIVITKKGAQQFQMHFKP